MCKFEVCKEKKNYARNSNFWNSKLLVNTYLFIYVQVCAMCEINERVRALGKLLLLFYLFVVEFEKYLNELNRSEQSQVKQRKLNSMLIIQYKATPVIKTITI